MAVLGYLPKIKRGLRLAFSTHFLHDFSIEMFLFNTLSTDKVSMSYLFFLLKISNKYVTTFLFRQLMTSKTLKFIFNKAMEDSEKITGRQKRKNLNILRTKRAF